MSILTNMIKELRERKLWPIAIGLIVALVAVPVLLSKKAPTNLVVPQPTGGLPYSTGTALPAISVETKPGSSKLAGRGRDPFTPQHVATTASATKVTTTTGAPVVTGSAGTTVATAPSAGSGSATSTPVTSSPAPASTPTTPTTPVTPKPAPAPAPSGLTAKQSYQVSLAITTSGGGLNTIDPLQRLSLLPSPQHPLLVELGVLQGGKRVLFAVQLGAAVSGPGTCIPGPIDCEVIALSPGQTGGLSKQTPSGPSGVAQFSVNSITAVDHPDVAAADAARAAAAAAGRKLLANSPLSGNGLFQYDPNVGAVVDLRNLTVGG
jgi:hypothetical protein